MRRFLHRHEPKLSAGGWVKAGLGGALGIGFVALVGHVGELPLLIAPFGASCVLLFAVPDSPLSQPANVVGGHLLATVIALGLHAALPDAWWGAGIAVGAAIFAMAAVRLTHPPAGADPVVVFLGHPGGELMMLTVLLGSVSLVLIAAFLHRIPPRRVVYPRLVPGRPDERTQA